MGRPKKQIDDVTLLEMRGEGKNLKEISEEMGISIPTLSKRIAYLQYHEGIFTKYRELQGLQLTELQAQILEAVSVINFENASLIELLRAFYVLKKAEKFIQGKDSFKIYGLLDHLLALESLEQKTV